MVDTSFNLLGPGANLTNLSINHGAGLSNLSIAKTGSLAGDFSGSISMPDDDFSLGAPSTIPRYPQGNLDGLLEEEEEDPLGIHGLDGMLDFAFDADGQMIDIVPDKAGSARGSSEKRKMHSLDREEFELDPSWTRQKRQRPDKDVGNFTIHNGGNRITDQDSSLLLSKRRTNTSSGSSKV